MIMVWTPLYLPFDFENIRYDNNKADENLHLTGIQLQAGQTAYNTFQVIKTITPFPSDIIDLNLYLKCLVFWSNCSIYI